MSGRNAVRNGFLVAAVGLSIVAGAAVGQIPGESAYDTRRSLRDEYRAVVYEEIRIALAEWTDHLNGRKIEELRKGVAETVLFAPIGWTVLGRASFADSLASWLPRIAGYHFIMADFDASGNLAYAYGTVRYHLTGPGAAGSDVEGEAVLVMYRFGSHWRIRSYVERPLAP